MEYERTTKQKSLTETETVIDDVVKIISLKRKELIKYGVLFFDTLQKAKDSIMEIEENAKSVDQLNIVIRAESDMEIEELTKHGKVFAGEAWALIHDRRVEDGWYDEPR